jgi:protocatechuate 3,4-dioxygenase beta subunit
MTKRRVLLRATLAAPAAWLLAAEPGAAQLAPTPACGDAEPTLRQTEGPYFTPSSPERTNLREPDVPGEPFVLTGLVLSTGCVPLAGAIVDLWHCDGRGDYDNEGFRCRGHQLTDTAGRWRFETVRPGLYTGRTRHFHLKAHAPGKRLLTTQLYFPGEPANARDRIWRPELEMDLGADGASGRFDLVLA